MTIHHDKLAYGKLAPTSENLSEERLKQMLAELNGEETDCPESAEAARTATDENTLQTSENGTYTAPNSKKKGKK